jgi:molecular chaperone DnaJ
LLGQIITAAPCGACSATGQTIPNPCPTCRGLGCIEGSRAIDVEVPAGIDEGQRLRLAGKGAAGPRGGGAGDLYVVVRVTPHQHFERRGDELWQRLPISIVQATLGTTVQLTTLDGPHELDVPSGTQHGAQFRIRGFGVPRLRGGRRGDLVLEAHVEVPTRLTAEEADVLVQFAALRGEAVTSPHDGLFSRIKSAFKT